MCTTISSGGWWCVRAVAWTMLAVRATSALGDEPDAQKDEGALRCGLILPPKQSVRGSFNAVKAIVEIKNISDKDVEIKWREHPLQALNFIIRDEKGAVVSKHAFSDSYSPRYAEDQTLVIKAGQSYQCKVSPWITIDESDHRAGSYSVTAVYKYEGRSYVSPASAIRLRLADKDR
jgi:hypothetical protein